MSTSFREPEEVREPKPEEPVDEGRTEISVEGFKPIESDRDLLDALGVEDDYQVLPTEDKEDFQELKGYLTSYMAEKGLPQTSKGVKAAIESLKEDVGLHREADPQAIIKRIGGIAKSWKELSFIRDVTERKAILSRLMRATTRQEMDSIVFQAMEGKKVWQQ